MVKINKKVEYALIVLKHMSTKQASSSKETLTTAREISDLYQTPFDTTAKVMGLMNSNGFFTSIKGVKGGYELNIELKNISYLQLVELIEGKSASMDCIDNKCNLLSSCNIVNPINKLNTHLMYFFKSLSLEELLNQHTNDPVERILKVTNPNTKAASL